MNSIGRLLDNRLRKRDHHKRINTVHLARRRQSDEDADEDVAYQQGSTSPQTNKSTKTSKTDPTLDHSLLSESSPSRVALNKRQVRYGMGNGFVLREQRTKLRSYSADDCDNSTITSHRTSDGERDQLNSSNLQVPSALSADSMAFRRRDIKTNKRSVPADLTLHLDSNKRSTCRPFTTDTNVENVPIATGRSEVQSDATRASTQIATNRAIDLAMRRIQNMQQQLNEEQRRITELAITANAISEDKHGQAISKPLNEEKKRITGRLEEHVEKGQSNFIAHDLMSYQSRSISSSVGVEINHVASESYYGAVKSRFHAQMENNAVKKNLLLPVLSEDCNADATKTFGTRKYILSGESNVDASSLPPKFSNIQRHTHRQDAMSVSMASDRTPDPIFCPSPETSRASQSTVHHDDLATSLLKTHDLSSICEPEYEPGCDMAMAMDINSLATQTLNDLKNEYHRKEGTRSSSKPSVILSPSPKYIMASDKLPANALSPDSIFASINESSVADSDQATFLHDIENKPGCDRAFEKKNDSAVSLQLMPRFVVNTVETDAPGNVLSRSKAFRAYLTSVTEKTRDVEPQGSLEKTKGIYQTSDGLNARILKQQISQSVNGDVDNTNIGVQSLKSAFESSHAHVGLQFIREDCVEDNDDSGDVIVKSSKEKFEGKVEQKASLVSTLRAKFESKRAAPIPSQQFKQAVSKFDFQPPRGRNTVVATERSIGNKRVDEPLAPTPRQEPADVTEPAAVISVKDRIRSFNESSASTRSDSVPRCLTSQVHPAKNGRAISQSWTSVSTYEIVRNREPRSNAYSEQTLEKQNSGAKSFSHAQDRPSITVVPSQKSGVELYRQSLALCASEGTHGQRPLSNAAATSNRIKSRPALLKILKSRNARKAARVQFQCNNRQTSEPTKERSTESEGKQKNAESKTCDKLLHSLVPVEAVDDACRSNSFAKSASSFVKTPMHHTEKNDIPVEPLKDSDTSMEVALVEEDGSNRILANSMGLSTADTTHPAKISSAWKAESAASSATSLSRFSFPSAATRETILRFSAMAKLKDSRALMQHGGRGVPVRPEASEISISRFPEQASSYESQFDLKMNKPTGNVVHDNGVRPKCYKAAALASTIHGNSTSATYTEEKKTEDAREITDDDSECSDGVTLDMSIADVSILTTPTALVSKAEDKNLALGAVPSSSESTESGATDDASSNQTSEAAAPLLSRARDEIPLSDDHSGSANSFFNRRVDQARSWTVGCEAPAIETRKAKFKRSNIFGDETGWNVSQISNLFPLTSNNHSKTDDHFNFDTLWHSFGMESTKAVEETGKQHGKRPTTPTRSNTTARLVPTTRQYSAKTAYDPPDTASSFPQMRTTGRREVVASSLVAQVPAWQRRTSTTGTRSFVSASSSIDLYTRIPSTSRSSPGISEKYYWPTASSSPPDTCGFPLSRQLRDQATTTTTRRSISVASKAENNKSAGNPQPQSHRLDMNEAMSRYIDEHDKLMIRLHTLRENRMKRGPIHYDRQQLHHKPSDIDEQSGSTRSSTKFGGRTFMASLDVD